MGTTASATTAESSPAGAPATPAGPAGTPGAPGAAVEVPATQDGEAPPAEEELQVKVKTVAEDERYSKFFKMLKMGVPLQAVKNKMFQEGLNGDILEDPDAPAEDA